MEEAALVALSLASAETAPTDIANDEPSQAEKRHPARELSNTMEGAGRKTDEIGIRPIRMRTLISNFSHD